MTPRIAAILSISGVLVAGTATAMINHQVLDSNAGSRGVPAAKTEPATTLDSSSTSIAITSTTVTSTSTSVTGTTTQTTTIVTVPSTTPPTPPPPTASQQTFQLGAAGSVILAVNGDVLSIVRVSPAPGWEVHEAENESSNSVHVRLRTDDSEVQFEASLVLGVINVHLEEDYDGSDAGSDDEPDDESDDD